MNTIMKELNQFVLVLSILTLFSCNNSKTDKELNQSLMLWYDKPAKNWIEALPLGNGRLGIMVYGNTFNEHIQLNDDSMWPADKGWKQPEGNKADLEEVRSLLFAGKHVEADKLMVEKFSNKGVKRSHQTLGDLFIDFNHQNITEYRRELDLNNAISKVSYKTNGHLVTEKMFVSEPHRVIVIEFMSESENGLNGKVRLSRPKDMGFPTAVSKTTKEGLLVMQGEVTQRNAQFNSESDPILEGVKFETSLKINNTGGEIIQGDDYLELKNVKQATFYIVSNSSFYHKDYADQNKRDLAAIKDISSTVLEKEHVQDYRKLFSRVSLDLGNNVLDSLPTNVRLERMKQDSADIGLEALLYQYGRYLLISSSRVGTNPANLQGLWNEHLSAPWNADYHLNINLQMNYWPANMTDLDELNMPLFDYIDRLVESGKETASKNFGCCGTFFPHATDIWADTWMRGKTAFWGSSMGAGGWMMQHYWQHYEFTQDKTFLKERAYPAMREVALFYSDWIIRDPRDGKLISAPSTSPENKYYYNDEKVPVALTLGSAMDQQIIAEVFDNYIETCTILGINDAFLEKIEWQRAELRPGFVLGDDGRILEWDRPYVEHKRGHRHMSHLYGFHPGSAVSKDKTPEVFEAVRKTLDFRLANGGGGTGWSRAWLINCSARLLDGDMAQEHILLLFKKSMYNNLFDAHPPFQIDGNFGVTSGMTEMLLQSHLRDEEGDYIQDILPALPSSLFSGSISGIKGRGAFEISIEWQKGVLVSVEVKSLAGNNLNLRYKGNLISQETTKGETLSFFSTDFK